MITRMQKHVFLSALVLVLFATSCVSDFKVSSDYDKSTDFTKYKTFTMLPWDNDVSTPVQDGTKRKILNAAKNEMIKRGYTYVEKGGDLAVGLSVLVEEKVEYRSDGSVSYGVGYGGYGYGGFGVGYSTPTTYRSYYYNEGTIIVDVFDERQKMLVWQGYGFDRLKDNPHKNQEKIDMYMKYIFKKYPGKVKK